MNRYMGTANGNRNRKDPGRIQEPFHYGSRILNGSRNRLKRIRIPSVETDPDTHPTNGSGFNGYGSLKGSCSTIIANSENLKVFFKWFFILNVICFLWKRIPYGSKLRIADPKRIQEPFETDPGPDPTYESGYGSHKRIRIQHGYGSQYFEWHSRHRIPKKQYFWAFERQ